MVSFLLVEPGGGEEESEEDLEQPERKKEGIKQKVTKKTKNGLECLMRFAPLRPGNRRLRLRLGLRVEQIMRSLQVVYLMGEFGVGGGVWSIFLEWRNWSGRGGGVRRLECRRLRAVGGRGRGRCWGRQSRRRRELCHGRSRCLRKCWCRQGRRR